MLVYKQLTILKSSFSETRRQRPVNIFDGVGGQPFFLFIYLSIFFFILRFHFPDLTFLKLFLLSFCLVLKTLACHYNCLFLRSVILFQRAEMRGILINFEPPEEIKYQELESGNPYKPLDNPRCAIFLCSWEPGDEFDSSHVVLIFGGHIYQVCQFDESSRSSFCCGRNLVLRQPFTI